MATLTSRLVVALIDQVSGPARKAGAAMRGLVQAGHAASAAHTRVVAGLQRQMMLATTQARATMLRMSDQTLRATAAFAAPLALAGRYGFQAAYQFAKVGNNVQAVTLMTDEQRKSLEAYAKSLNALFPYMNSEIMNSAFELGRAGLNFDQVMGSLRDTLNLGLAGDIDLKEAADIATNILTAMRLPMKTTEEVRASLLRVNDALAYVATNSNTDVRMMGETLKYVGPIAAAAGLSLEHIAAASMVMARSGIRASEAGVAMRSALVRMVRPTKPMLVALDQLNVKISDFIKGGRQIKGADVVKSLMGDGVDASAYVDAIDAALSDPKLQRSTSAMVTRIADIVSKNGSVVDRKVLADAISDTLTAAGSEVDFFGFIKALQEKGVDVAGIARIFDARQGSRLITLFKEDLSKALDEVQKNAAGSADRMAKLRMQGIVGEVARFKAGWENLWVTIGESGVLSQIGAGLTRIAEGMERLAKSNPALLKLSVYALGSLAILGPLGLMISGVAATGGLLVGGIKLLAFGAAAAATGGLLALLRMIGALARGLRLYRIAALAAAIATAPLAATAATAAAAGAVGAGTAAAGGAAAGAAGRVAASKTATKLGLRFIPGIGWIVGAAFLGHSLYKGEGKVDEGDAGDRANAVAAIGRRWRRVDAPQLAKNQMSFPSIGSSGALQFGIDGVQLRGDVANWTGSGDTSFPNARPKLDASDLDDANNAFELILRKIEEVNGKATRPEIDASEIEKLIKLISQADAGLTRLGHRAAGVHSDVSNALQPGGKVRQAMRGVHADTSG